MAINKGCGKQPAKQASSLETTDVVHRDSSVCGTDCCKGVIEKPGGRGANTAHTKQNCLPGVNI